MLPETAEPILFFDGVCNLCNRFVQVVIRNDKKAIFRFASLQSRTGQQVQDLIKEREGRVPDSLVLWYKNEYYIKSDAVLKAAGTLGGFWLFLLPGYLLPRFVRNKIYDFVARNRYRWFGRKDECMIPTEELKSRFLD